MAADLLSIGAPSRRELGSRRRYRHGSSPAGPPGEQWGRYILCERVPCGPGEECFVGCLRGSQFDAYVFVRRFPAAWLDDAGISALKARGLLTHRGVEGLHELGTYEGRGFVVSDLVEGLALDRLDELLLQRGERLPWPLALAIFHDAYERLVACRAAGVLHSDVTPARLRLSLDGALTLCGCLPDEPAPVWGRALCEAARAALVLAATPAERALLDDLLDDDLPAALEAASDAIVQQHPELDPLLPEILLAAAREPPPALHRVLAALAECLDREDVRWLWKLVADHRG